VRCLAWWLPPVSEATILPYTATHGKPGITIKKLGRLGKRRSIDCLGAPESAGQPVLSPERTATATATHARSDAAPATTSAYGPLKPLLVANHFDDTGLRTGKNARLNEYSRIPRIVKAQASIMGPRMDTDRV